MKQNKHFWDCTRHKVCADLKKLYQDTIQNIITLQQFGVDTSDLK